MKIDYILKKYIEHLDKFETSCYDATTGLLVDCSSCDCDPDCGTFTGNCMCYGANEGENVFEYVLGYH